MKIFNAVLFVFAGIFFSGTIFAQTAVLNYSSSIESSSLTNFGNPNFQNVPFDDFNGFNISAEITYDLGSQDLDSSATSGLYADASAAISFGESNYFGSGRIAVENNLIQPGFEGDTLSFVFDFPTGPQLSTPSGLTGLRPFRFSVGFIDSTQAAIQSDSLTLLETDPTAYDFGNLTFQFDALNGSGLATSISGPVSSIPEPSAMLLYSLLTAWMFLARRCRMKLLRQQSPCEASFQQPEGSPYAIS